uniref:Store-operated calcium entry-associated regulatory factor n=1 Tax=Physcomitrium patens TaxID=3218 RepID=A0A2K1ITM2_PHYPA|nr:hypothetical protein PHYPA_024566 [Physcomitrium patens]
MRLSGVATRVLIVVGWLGMLLALACGHHQLTQSAAMQSQSLQVNSAAASLEEGAPRESLKAHGAESEFVNQMKKMEFHKGLNTSYKRAEPIPQLRCLEGCDNYEPSMVQCSNIKNDRNPKWQCEADLPRHLKFHKTTINCEGFDSVKDEKVLQGSCGLEYSLINSGMAQPHTCPDFPCSHSFVF